MTIATQQPTARQNYKPIEQLKAYREAANKMLLKTAFFGGLGLGLVTAAVSYSVNDRLDLGLISLGTCAGAAVAVGTRACTNQPASTEALALTVNALEEGAHKAQIISEQLSQHRTAAGNLQRELTMTRSQATALQAEISSGKEQIAKLNALILELLAKQSQPQATAKVTAKIPAQGTWSDASADDYWSAPPEADNG